jgi:5S rRNA maturation endonuclease (ribonuclease M5)
MDYNSIKSYFKIKEDHGDKCKAICPAHPDREASLSIGYDGEDNKTLIYCHAGCETIDVIERVGLKITDLFDRELIKENAGSKQNNIEAVYQYKDKENNLAFEKIRFKGKKFSQRRLIDGQTIWGLEKGTYYETFPGSNSFSWKKPKKNPEDAKSIEVEGTEPVLYNLPALLDAAENNKTIFIVEGEKDADNVSSLGLVATCNFDGASKSTQKTKWKKIYNEFFRNAKVVLLPDNDEPGQAHMDSIAKSLHGIAESIKIINLAELPDKGDVSDWLKIGHTKDELLAIVKQTQVWSPEDSGIVEEDNYGIYERNNSYCKWVKDDLQSVSNFIINVNSVIVADTEVYINAVFLNTLGEKMEKTFLTEAFDSIKQLRATLSNPYFSFWGNDKELQTIRNMIFSKDHKHKIGVKCIGFHKINGNDVFVSTDGVIDSDGNKVEDVVMLDDYTETTTNLLTVEPITADELRVLAKNLFNFNRLGITATVLGYTAGTFLAEKLRNRNIKYNHLMVEGPPGSGKSQTVEAIITGILGVEREDILDIGQCTNFALTKASSSSNVIPLILNEYKPNKIGPIKVNLVSTIMRNSYDNSGVRKGTANLKKNKEFNYRAPMIVVGESGMSETANVERSLKVMFYKKSHTTERFAAMAELKEDRSLLNKFGRLLLNLALKKDSKELAEKHKKLFIQMAKVSIRDDRVKESISNCILGLALVKEAFKAVNLDIEQETGYKMSELIDAVRDTASDDLLMGAEGSKNVIDLTLETLNRMAINNVLVNKCDYDAVMDKDGEFVLRLNYKAFYDRFLKYCKDNKIEHEVLQIESFEQQLSNMDYCKASKKGVKFKLNNSFNETKNFRSMIIFADKLKERNIDVDYMIDNKLTESELKVVGLSNASEG